MKKYILITLSLAFAAQTTAQNNLVFNQVLEFRINNSNSTATVPQGKVWKVEHSNSSFYATKADVEYGSPLSTSYFAGTSGGQNAVWFSEGTSIGSNSNGDTSFSILEFNVVPISSSSGSSSGGGGVSADGLVFEEAITQTLTPTGELNANTRLFGEIVVQENRILKIIGVSTYGLSTSTGGTANEGNGWVYIGDDLFSPAASNYSAARNRFLPSGTYIAKIDWDQASMPNRLVVNAILYSKP
jgi:hypothetical protein